MAAPKLYVLAVILAARRVCQHRMNSWLRLLIIVRLIQSREWVFRTRQTVALRVMIRHTATEDRKGKLIKSERQGKDFTWNYPRARGFHKTDHVTVCRRSMSEIPDWENLSLDRGLGDCLPLSHSLTPLSTPSTLFLSRAHNDERTRTHTQIHVHSLACIGSC